MKKLNKNEKIIKRLFVDKKEQNQKITQQDIDDVQNAIFLELKKQGIVKTKSEMFVKNCSTKKGKAQKTQREILIENADDVIEMVREAKSYKEIQKKYSVHPKYLSEFMTSGEYSALVREAQKESAEVISAKAEEVLMQLEKGMDQAEITRARELAHHYRWLAAKKNPQRFGDSTKIQAEVKDTSSTSSWLGEVLSEIDKNK